MTLWDPSGKGIIPVDLQGIVKTFLDHTFYPRIQKLIEKAKQAEIELKFDKAFRTTKQQKDECMANPDFASEGPSLHEASFAVDIDMRSMSVKQQDQVVGYAKEAGLSWGGDWIRKKERWHYYRKISGGNRKEYDDKSMLRYYLLTVPSNVESIPWKEK